MIILDGKKVAQEIYHEISNQITKSRLTPGLAIILVGQRKDSLSYVNMKIKMCTKLNIDTHLSKLPEDITDSRIIERIEKFNQDSKVHGILVQLPLPPHLDTDKILNHIDIKKDVDGCRTLTLGKLAVGQPRGFAPCTPVGCLELLDRYQIPLVGKHVVILGKSRIVGMPMALLFLQRGATVTVCDENTDYEKEKELCRMADILISACGQAEMVKADWIQDGAIVIDVGINHLPDPSAKRGYRLVGDVDFEDVREKVKAITPVPGGVGPMTIAILMKQVVDAARFLT